MLSRSWMQVSFITFMSKCNVYANCIVFVVIIMSQVNNVCFRMVNGIVTCGPCPLDAPFGNGKVCHNRNYSTKNQTLHHTFQYQPYLHYLRLRLYRVAHLYFLFFLDHGAAITIRMMIVPVSSQCIYLTTT